MTEFQAAYRLAQKTLDDIHADPDSDLSVLARQFLRSVERENNLRAGRVDEQQTPLSESYDVPLKGHCGQS